MQTFLRFVLLLSLVVWLGGLIFFAFVVAPTVFHPGILPTRDLAGNVVNRSLSILHFTGLTCGVVFLLVSLVLDYLKPSSIRLVTATHVLVIVMIVLTLIAQFGVAPRMAALRTGMGVIDNVSPSDARRVEFNRLHQWSTRLGGSILILGLGVLLLTARRLS